MKPRRSSRVAKIVSLFCVFWVISDIRAGELLGHISDDTEQVVAPVAEPKNDRNIIYRVICSPDGEMLPDCERPFTDREALPASMAKEELPVSDNNAGESTEKAAVTEKPAKSPVKTTKGKKHTITTKNKRKTGVKKSAKKTKSRGH